MSCMCIEKSIGCMEGRCATFSINGILDDIQSIEFGVLGTWSNEIMDSLASYLYEREFKTIDEFYGSFDYFVSSDDDFLRRRVLMDKFKYIQEKMTDILKKRIGYSDKNEAIIRIEKAEYKIDFKKRTISHTIDNEPNKGRYYMNYGAQVKDLEYFFLKDPFLEEPIIEISHGVTTNNIHVHIYDEDMVKRTELCSFYINDRYVDEPDLEFSRLDAILAFDFGDSDSDIEFE